MLLRQLGYRFCILLLTSIGGLSYQASGQGVLDSLWQQGMIYGNEGKFDEALDIFTKVANQTPSHDRRAAALELVSQCYYYQGQMQQALFFIDSALQLDYQSPLLDSTYIQVVRNYSIYQNNSSLDSAQYLIEKELNRVDYRKHQDKDYVYWELLNGYYLLIGSHQTEKAIKIAKDILRLKKKRFGTISPEVANQYSDLGFLYSSLGQSDSSIYSYQKSIEAYLLDSAQHYTDLGLSHNNVAFEAEKIGAFQEALSHYFRAYYYWSEDSIESAHYLNKVLHNIGNCFSAMGMYPESVLYYKRSMESLTYDPKSTLQDSIDLAFELARAFCYANKLDESKRYERQMLQWMAQTNAHSGLKGLYYEFKTGQLINDLSVGVLDWSFDPHPNKEKVQKAYAYLQKAALYHLDTLGNSTIPTLLKLKLLRAEWLLGKPTATALDELRMLQSEQMGLMEQQFYAYLYSGFLFRKEGCEPAVSAIDQSLRKLWSGVQKAAYWNQMPTPETLPLTQDVLGLFVYRAQLTNECPNESSDAEFYDYVFQYIDALLSQTELNNERLFEQIRTILEAYFIRFEDQISFEQLQTLYLYKSRNVVSRASGSYGLTVSYDKFIQKQQRKAKLESQLYRNSSETAAIERELELINQELMSVFVQKDDRASQVFQSLNSKKLQKETTYIDFFEGEDHLWVFYYTSDQIESVRFSLQEFRLLCDQFRSSILDREAHLRSPQEQKNQFIKSGRALYNMILGRIPDHFPTYHIVLLPDGYSGQLPWHLTLTQEVGTEEGYSTLPYAFQGHSIRYSYRPIEEGITQDVPNNLAVWAPSYNYSVTAFPKKNADYADIDRSGDWSLPYAKQEAQDLSDQYSADVYTDSSAMIEAFVQNAPKYGIHHFAMHTILDDKEARYSALLFQEDSIYKGLLDINMIYQLNLPARLVVLAACNTGYHPQTIEGYGMHTIGKAFAAAGAQSILMSQWRIPDQAAHTQMQHFYQSLSEGKKVSASWSGMMNRYLAEADEISQHPYYWGGFMIVGADQSIDFASSDHYMYWIVGGLIIGLLFVLFYRFRKRGIG